MTYYVLRMQMYTYSSWKYVMKRFPYKLLRPAHERVTLFLITVLLWSSQTFHKTVRKGTADHHKEFSLDDYQLQSQTFINTNCSHLSL